MNRAQALVCGLLVGIAVFASLLLGPVGLAAQETVGHLRGALRSEAGPLAGAEIVAAGPAMIGSRRAVAAADGVFLFLSLPPGEYALRITAIGHRPVSIIGVRVQLGRVTGLGAIELEAATAMLEAVTITAPAVTLDPVRTTIGATLEASDLAALPGERDYKSLMAILPHANTSYHGDPVNVAGSTGLENMYFIDGANVTSPMTGATGTSLPSNFVRAVEVRAGGYEAQFGRALGAIVNAVTWTGTNTHEGAIFAFGTHASLAGEPRAMPNLRESGAYSYDVGARVSGPIRRDRMWYSAAVNPRREHVERTITGLGAFADSWAAWVFAGKLTWQARPTLGLEVSLLGDPAIRQAVEPFPWLTGLTSLNPDTYLSEVATGGTTISLHATHNPNARLLLEATITRSSGRSRTTGRTDLGRTEPLYVDYLAGTIEGGLGWRGNTTHGRTAASLRTTWSTGRHTAVAGFEFEDNTVTQEFENPGIGYIERWDSVTWVVFDQATAGAFHNRVPTAYLQDTWRISRRLTLNAGVRWTGQYLTGASGRTVQRFPDEWQPRLGFSLETAADARQRIFGSAGRFYQQAPLNLPSLYYVDYAATQRFFSVDPRQPGAAADSGFDFSTYEADFAVQVEHAEVEHHDEVTLGYERLIGTATRVVFRGIRRELRSTFQQGIDFSQSPPFIIGTAGEGSLAFLPSPVREYTALELSVEGRWRRYQYRVSYVLSRTWGNYTGLYSSDSYSTNPGVNAGLGTRDHMFHTTGLLPNDRTHVFKLVAAFPVFGPVSTGIFFTAQSGTPLSDLGAGTFGFPLFLQKRGSIGRTPALWDLNVRLARQAGLPGGVAGRLVLDVLHLGNPRGAVRRDMQRFFTRDAQGYQANLNPGYMRATVFQPPMAARLGVELAF